MTISVGRETTQHISPTKINETNFAKVSPSHNNYSFRIINHSTNNNQRQPTTTNNQQQASIPSVPSFCVTCCEMNTSWQPVTGAAQRRKQCRLRSRWRHEQQSIAAALATLQHHSAPWETEDGQGEEDHELHGHVPGASSSQGGRCAALLLRRRRATGPAPGQTGCLPCLDGRSGFCGTPWSSLPTACGSCRGSMLLCRSAARLGASSVRGSRSLLVLEHCLCSSKPRASTETMLCWTRPGIALQWR